MVQRWDLEIERQLPGNFLLSMGYVGNHGTHLVGDEVRNIDYVPVSEQIQLRQQHQRRGSDYGLLLRANRCSISPDLGEQPTPATAFCYPLSQPTRASSQLPAFDGNSVYDALNVRLQKHLSSGFTFVAAYTNSKKITRSGDHSGRRVYVGPVPRRLAQLSRRTGGR